MHGRCPVVRRGSPDPVHESLQPGRGGWAANIQRWMVWLLSRYSDAYASDQYRALRQFFRWWAEEEDLPDPIARLRAPCNPESHDPFGRQT